MTILAAATASGLQMGCGKPPQSPEPLPVDPTAPIPVEGGTAFASQCIFGSQSEPRPAPVNLWDCPINLKKLELTEPLQPLIFSADCKKKLLTIRSLDRRVDTGWEVMPDGSFSVTLDKLTASLKTDGVTTTGCTAYLLTDVWGSVDCTDRDKANIKFDMISWLNKGPRPSPSPHPLPPGPNPPTPGSGSNGLGTTPAPDCRVPPTCYMHASSVVNQCQ